MPGAPSTLLEDNLKTQPTWIVVHPSVDLDACACVALSGVSLGNDMPVHFWPAGLKARPETCPCCNQPVPEAVRILDHSLGQKGVRDSDGRVHAAACSMTEAAQWNPALLVQIDEQDSEGTITGGELQLARLLNATRAHASRELCLQGRELDAHVVAVMGGLLRGLNLQYHDTIAACAVATEMATRGDIVQIGNFRVALLPPEQVPALGFVLERVRGVDCAIYVDGHNLGISRYPKRIVPDLRRLAEHLPGWFVHTHGFLAGWGTRGAPKSEPPPAGTPQNAAELLALLRRVFTPAS